MFELSWTYQVPDEESDEFYQLKVCLYYSPEEENRGIQECEFYDGDASLPVGAGQAGAGGTGFDQRDLTPSPVFSARPPDI